MGKTFTRDQRKNNKYVQWDQARKRKLENYEVQDEKPRPKPKKKWRPHSEIDAD